MGIVLLLAGVGLLSLPGAARTWGRRLPPAEWVVLTTVALMVGAVVVELALLLHAAPGVLRAVGVTQWAALCERMSGFVMPGGALAGWLLAGAGILLPLRVIVGVRAAARAARAGRADPWLGEHRRLASGQLADGTLGAVELVVLPVEAPLAVSVPGRSGRSGRFGRWGRSGPSDQVVISEGLIARLTSTELDAVLRHETAHLTHRHHRHLQLAQGLEGALGFLLPVRDSLAVLRLALERWADEDAAGRAPAGRRQLRQALVAVASAQLASPSLAALSAADTIEERLVALDGPVPKPSARARVTLYTVGASLLAVAVLALDACAG